MRLFRSLAPVTAAVALVLCPPYGVYGHARAEHPEPFGAECRIEVSGSRVVARCHNPYADTDRVSLHIECERWWDVDTDGAPADVGPARSVRLAGRCWKEVGSAWVSHQKR
ncbi:hypothetical protein GCM10010269_75460 [Streptomyces humidus]|uniref:Uncharacterized protein n=1 Tax=Streptomyces humidus TaxID=52259 RepID=A0A918GA67_9ACTN|nr:hypothetical protein [Streptomyces humidus]GGS25734.1 hypothetical protein GCM10010269_75460 [Streptomyces humidus]